MRRRNRLSRPKVITPEVAALRRRVLRVRVVVLLAVAMVVAGWYAYWDLATASLRMPEVALAEGSQVFTAAEGFLVTQSAQLSLRATVTDFARVGRPGAISPYNASRQGNTNYYWVQLQGYGSVNDTGAPVVGPVVSDIAGHTTGRGGRVNRITVECTYLVCWDRKTVTGRRTVEGEDVPPNPGELLDGRQPRYGPVEQVTDRLVLGFSTRRGRWEVVQLLRISSTRISLGY